VKIRPLPQAFRLPLLTVAAALAYAPFAATARIVENLTYTCSRYEAQTKFHRIGCFVPDGLTAPAAVYVVLEQQIKWAADCYAPLMKSGAIPPGMVVSVYPGVCYSEDGKNSRWMRAVESDAVGPEFPSAIADEIVPFCARTLGITVDPSPDRWFISGASSGGIAAFNACWFRNDRFRRCFCNSPTFSNVRAGNTLMPIVRKCETRPIRVWVSTGTHEPDYYFGDSYFAAMESVAALRFAGYEVRFDRFAHEGHGARFNSVAYNRKVLTWLFENWKKQKVTVSANPIRVRNLVVKNQGWTACDKTMPPPVRELRSVDGWRTVSVDPTNRFVMTSRLRADGTRDQTYRLAPLELAWNVSRPGGRALALTGNGRYLVATELGVQAVVPHGLADLILPLPGDVPCDNITLEGTTLYAAGGGRVFRRTITCPAADPAQAAPVKTPGYSDSFRYSREHDPAGGLSDLIGSYVMAGRIAGVVSILSDPDGKLQTDIAGFADLGGPGRRGWGMSADALFAVFSMTKTFTGAALMCAIDEGKISLDDKVSRFLPEFADVRMKDGGRPKREITIRDLMSHVSGFRGGEGVVNREIPLREVARRLAARPLAAQPGETFAYGNAWICSAAAALEVATGKAFDAYLKEKILDPLDMTDTTFHPTADQLRRLVRAYTSHDGPMTEAKDNCAKQLVFPKAKKIYPAASGGLFSTPRNMIRFAQMLARRGEWNGRRLISRETFDTYFATRQTPAHLKQAYSVGCWIDGDWMRHEGAMRTDLQANIKTGHARVFFIQTENAAGSAFAQLKRDWTYEADKAQFGERETK
jgi:CubicO group peptidase (beta-lactamase class C family)